MGLPDLLALATSFMTELSLRTGEWVSHFDQHLLLNYIAIARLRWPHAELSPLTNTNGPWKPSNEGVDLSLVFGGSDSATLKISILGDNLGFRPQVNSIALSDIMHTPPCVPADCDCFFDAVCNILVVSVPGIKAEHNKDSLTIILSTSFSGQVCCK
jgi:hypothetical protein